MAGPPGSEADVRSGKLLRSYGYSCPAELFQTMKDWCVAHKWCTETMTQALLFIMNLSSAAEIREHVRLGYRIKFILTLGEKDPTKRTALNAFRIVDYSWALEQSTPEGLMQDAFLMAGAEVGYIRSGQTPPALLPVGFSVEDFNQTIHTLLYLKHLPRDSTPLKYQAWIELVELVEFCKASVNSGRVVWGQVGDEPVVGRMSKRWEWKPLAAYVGQWKAMAKMVNEQVGYKFRTGLPLRELLMGLNQVCQQGLCCLDKDGRIRVE